MRIKRITLSTRLSDLYGKDNYHSHIEEGREYWYYFSGENKISEKYGNGWYKIKVTYIRSGCMFYIFPAEVPKLRSFLFMNCPLQAGCYGNLSFVITCMQYICVSII